MDSNTIFSIVFIILIAAIGYVLVRGRLETDGKLSILEYGELLLQADKTARIIVRGVQEEWRNGTIEDDQRTHEAVKQLKELYPQIDDKELIRIVKSAVYLLRLGAGKQVDKVLEQVPDELPTLNIGTTGSVADGYTRPWQAGSARSDLHAKTFVADEIHLDSATLHHSYSTQWGGDMLAQSSGGVIHTNQPG